MTRHALVRNRSARRAAAAVVASMALAAGLSPALPSAAVAAEAPQETVVPAALQPEHPYASVFNPGAFTGADGAGAQGVFHRLTGHTGPLWTRDADGKTIPAPKIEGAEPSGTGSDVLAYRHQDGRIDLWDATDGTTRTVQVPAGDKFLGVYGTTVATFTDLDGVDGKTRRVFRLLTPGPDGATRTTAISGVPEGMLLGGSRGADDKSLLFRAFMDGSSRMVTVDRETGRVTGWTGPLPLKHTNIEVSPDHIALYEPDTTKVLVVSRAELSAAPVEVQLDGGRLNKFTDLTVVGDWLLHRPGGGAALKAAPIAGGEPVTVITSSRTGVSAGPGGTAVVVGRTAADDWGVQRIAAGPDGRPAVRSVKPLPKPPAVIQGISLEQGRLVVTDNSTPYRDDHLRTVAVSGRPEFGPRTHFTGRDVLIAPCSAKDSGCSGLHGTADGRIAWLERDTDPSQTDRLRVNGPGSYDFFERSVPAGGRITDVSGDHLIHTAAGRQSVYRLDDHAKPVVTRAPGAAAVDSGALWTAGSAKGSVTGLDLTTKKALPTLATGANCVPDELQSVGRWLYWSCGAGAEAGVYDRTAKKSVPVPSGEARLGDGFVAVHDKKAGKLTVTTVAGGPPATRVVGELPDTGVSQRDVRWTVDESGANLAYADGQERVHLVPSGAPSQPLRLLAPADSAESVEAIEHDAVPGRLTTVLLSKPSSAWRLTVRDKASGRVVDTAEGGAARGELSVGWNGADKASRVGDLFFPNGAYDWTLSITPADGTGAPLEVRDTVTLSGGSPVRRDHAGPYGDVDLTGDLLTLNSSGSLTFQHGDARKDAFAGKTSGSGWPASVLPVPFGDLNRDRCNDVLVRMKDGSLRGYTPKCGKALTPSTPYTKLGTGWSAYNVLTSPGDLTGDGLTDLVGRKSSTGDLHLFAATSNGKLAAGKKIRSDWKSFTKIAGAGDLTGDGVGDVLARHKDGTLHRYDGDGKGGLKDRVKVFSGWGASYNAVVGAGDITGDGKGDLIVRDTAGDLYRNDGKGNGSFGPRKKIASGWGAYKGIF